MKFFPHVMDVRELCDIVKNLFVWLVDKNTVKPEIARKVFEWLKRANQTGTKAMPKSAAASNTNTAASNTTLQSGTNTKAQNDGKTAMPQSSTPTKKAKKAKAQRGSATTHNQQQKISFSHGLVWYRNTDP